MTGQSFNSTLVQLKDWNMKMWRQKYRCFNSTLVQLKAMAVTGPGYIIHCFNSTLVQLKAVGFALPDGVDFRFQFYLSSIKSRPVHPKSKATTVSILP